ncbi:hypothetical protein Y032_0443g1554 [Ancylostoma ceylanicum]|uniref:Chondroitin proteoglycan 4 domain-containing protein n=2 Tax=Ancylostoma ceylanicum TaxID=53326 RepID=A0A016WYT5_9BILA|nr:hypothetical protein Y032_0443g1554 [Ancylostoma ceylanicum]
MISALLIIFLLPGILAQPRQQDDEKASECLKKCVGPLAKVERSFSYLFNHYEEICDMLETGAFCARKCEKEDMEKFHQYTTFYRIHCVDYEEDLEPHLPCLRKAAKDADSVCKDKCHNKYKIEKKDEKEKQEKKGCLTLECSTVCYFQEFIEECPEAKDALLKLNVGQIHTIALTIHPISFERMTQECRNVHDTDHMKKRMLEGLDN